MIANIWHGTVYQTNYTGFTAHSHVKRDYKTMTSISSPIFLECSLSSKCIQEKTNCAVFWTRWIFLRLIWFNLITCYNENYRRIACTSNEFMNYFEAKIVVCVFFISYKWVLSILNFDTYFVDFSVKLIGDLRFIYNIPFSHYLILISTSKIIRKFASNFICKVPFNCQK